MKKPSLRDGADRDIQKFLEEKLRKVNAQGYVLGVSGGIDSAVVLSLAVRAVGGKKILALIMPDKATSKKDVEDAVGLCRSLKVRRKTIDVSNIVEANRRARGGGVGRMPLANIKARCRMILLYYHAATERRLVLGTSNKSELLVGYFTKYGDGGADLEPIGDLYKTEVRQLGQLLGVPEAILKKAPSAGLWRGQTDEEELGISYERLDAILLGMEHGLDERTIAENSGANLREVRRIEEKVRLSSHKRKFPAVAKLSLRTPGLDWREGDEDI